MNNITPMHRQYKQIKQQYPDAVLLFRLGDFYEMFGDDAVLSSRVLELTLTSREFGKGQRIPMCGVPHHALDRYLRRLIQAGYKVAICDQVEDPKKAKKLVKREVTRVVTPGTLLEDSMLEAGANNFLVAVAAADRRVGLAALDVSTGDFLVTEFDLADDTTLADEIARINPAEILIPGNLMENSTVRAAVESLDGVRVTSLESEQFATETPREALLRHFGTQSLRGFGCEEMPLAVHAAADALRYVRENQLAEPSHIRGLRTYSTSEFMVLDSTTRRNLELTESLRPGEKGGTLLWLLDKTVTRMGARLLRQWLLQPLLDVAAITARLDAVEALLYSTAMREGLREALRSVYDIERLMSRTAVGMANARDLASLAASIRALPMVRNALEDEAVQKAPLLMELRTDLDLLEDVGELITSTLVDAPPISVTDGGIIRDGVDGDLDELRRASSGGKEWIAQLELSERNRTGIKSLKVGFNQVFGYYIEVTKPNLHLVPPEYIRKQTMANAERFITPELKEQEAKVLGAEEKIAALEYEIFVRLRSQVARHSARVLATAKVLAQLDVLASFAQVALENDYTKPVVDRSDRIEIADGRHPVVEKTRPEEPFVPNDCALDNENQQMIILTGPNMAGKSTYLRQVALIVLMAQIGCFVPAKSARIGVVDRIFTRVGARDDLATGQSTFMVEMNETANILHNATDRSLIILDEIGRGTSTFDGLSIAWAVAEYIHNRERIGAKTLFATHYHHLNELENLLPRAKNYRVAVKEQGDDVIFLRRVVEGGTDRSYGIEVARLAGLPDEVVQRAREVLQTLEKENLQVAPSRKGARHVPPPVQMTLFEATPDPLVEELKSLDIESLTPLEALNRLHEMREKARRRGEGKESA